ncbi:tape measure protein [Xanthobacteraceae bacterium A53D]
MATDIEKLVVQLSADVRQYQRGLQNAMGVTNRQARAIEARWSQANRKLDGIGSSMANGLVAPLTGIAAALSVREVAAYADAWTKAKNSLAVAGVVGQKQVEVLDQLYQSAQSNSAPLEAMASLFGKAAQASDNLGASTEDLVKFSDGVGVALRVAGTSATEASGALMQLGQLLGSARVQAEEFNSVNEGARPILIAVANGLEAAGGSVSKLKTLVNDGKVSSQEFFRAFMKGLPTIQAMAANATMTIEQGFTKVNNALTRYIGQTDEGLGASQRVAAGLNALADNFDKTADVVLQLVAVIAGALVGRAIGGMIAQLGLATVAAGKFLAALRAAVTLGGLGTALGGLAAAAGPLGLIIGTTVVGSLVLFSSSSEKASSGADVYAAALKQVREEADKASKSIDTMSAAQRKTAAGNIAKGLEAASSEQQKLVREFEGMIGLLDDFSMRDIVTKEQISQLRDLHRDFKDGKINAEQLQSALQALAKTSPGKLDGFFEPILKDLRETLAATGKLKQEMETLRPPTARESENASMAAYEKMAAAGKKFSDEIERRAGLTKEQLALEKQIEEVRKRAKADGVSLTEGQIKKLAETELAGDASRSSEGKAPKATADDRLGYDIQSIRDRIAALDLERETIGLSVGEQQKRQMALQLEQQALADLREEARRNGETDLANITISQEQRAAIDEVAEAWGRASEKLDQAALAQQRFNELQSEIGNYAIDLATNWTSVNDALKDGLQLLARMVAQAAIMGEGPLAGLFGGAASGGGAGGLIGALFGGLKGFDTGGYTGPGGKRTPKGVVHAGEVVFSQKDVRRHGGVGAVEAMRLGMRGYSDGGVVMPTVPRIPSPAAVRGAAQGGTSLTLTSNIDARGSQMSEAQFKAVLDERDRRLMKQLPAVVEQKRGRVISGRRT